MDEETMQWFADNGFNVIIFDEDGPRQVKESRMDAATLKDYLNHIEQAVGEGEDDPENALDEVMRIVNRIRDRLREEERNAPPVRD